MKILSGEINNSGVLKVRVTNKNPQIIKQNNLWVLNPNHDKKIIKDYKIYIPSAMYPTLDELFEVLNDLTSVFIPSGLKQNVTSEEIEK